MDIKWSSSGTKWVQLRDWNYLQSDRHAHYGHDVHANYQRLRRWEQ